MPRKPAESLRDRVALGVARGLSVSASAKAEGVNERTARSWSTSQDFKDIVKRLREDVLRQAVGILSVLSLRASVRLGTLVDSKDEEVALKACNSLLDKLMMIRQHSELVEQSEALAARLAELESRRDRP